MLVGIPCEDCELRECFRVARMPDKVVSAIGTFLLILEVRQRVIAHGPRLGVIEGRVHVKVQQVLGRILSDTQVPRCRSQLVVLGGHGRCGLVEVLHLLTEVFIVRGITVAVRVTVRVGVAGVRVAGACIAVGLAALSLTTQLPSTLLPLLLEHFFLLFQPLLQLGPLLHLCRLLVAALILNPLPLILDVLIVFRLKAVPAVALAIVVQLKVIDVLIGHEVLAIVGGLHRTRPLDAVLLGMRCRTAILASALDELGLHITLGAAYVPILGALLLNVPRLMVLQRRLVLVEVPWRLRNELWIVRVDHLARRSIELGRGGTRRTRLLKSLLLLAVIG
mmetsp:Transcript_102792/g.265721  ORF Transcript_102792/g.265721 Transcript_102792/m.265721 type:complete len:335 (+) Transcript_102792:1036-2040(+)